MTSIIMRKRKRLMRKGLNPTGSPELVLLRKVIGEVQIHYGVFSHVLFFLMYGVFIFSHKISNWCFSFSFLAQQIQNQILGTTSCCGSRLSRLRRTSSGKRSSSRVFPTRTAYPSPLWRCWGGMGTIFEFFRKSMLGRYYCVDRTFQRLNSIVWWI